MIVGYQLSRLVRVLAIALSGWPLPRPSAQTNRLDVLLVGGRVTVLAVALALIAQPAAAQSPLFDSHVHLWNGEESLQAYDEQLKEGRLEVAGIGAMWFGGPNQALAGQPTQIRAGNDGIIALAAKHPKMMPIATVHPYDGPATVAELERVAAKGIKALKLHPHTQKFDPDDPRVLMLVQRAGELGVIALIDNANILPGDSEKLFNLALKAPKTKFIFAHLGAMNFRFWNILKAARTAQGLFGDNIYFDISAIVVLVADSPIEDEFVWTMRNVGIECAWPLGPGRKREGEDPLRELPRPVRAAVTRVRPLRGLTWRYARTVPVLRNRHRHLLSRTRSPTFPCGVWRVRGCR